MPSGQPFRADTQTLGPSLLERYDLLYDELNLVVAHKGRVAIQESFSPSETVFPCLLPVQQFLVVVRALPAAQLGLGHPKYLKIIFNAGLAKLPAVSFKIGHFQSRPGPLNWHGVHVLLHPEKFFTGVPEWLMGNRWWKGHKKTTIG